TEVRYRRHDGVALRVVEQRRDQAAVDLDAIEWQRLELGQGCITRAKVIERDGHAQILETGHRRQGKIMVFHEAILGHLDLKALRRKSDLGENLHDLLRQSRILELDGRDVNGDLEVGRPFLRLVQRLAHDRQRKAGNERARLGGVNEIAWFQQAPLRMLPAREHFKAGQVSRLKIDQRLKE